MSENNVQCGMLEQDIPTSRAPGAEIGLPPSLNPSHPIKITEVVNGYRVFIGCQEVVFESRGKLIQELDRYLKNRVSVEREYLEKKK